LLLRRACHAAKLAAERRGALATLKPCLVEQLERRYDAIVTAGPTRPNRHSAMLPSPARADYVAAHRAAPDIISSCASNCANRMRCASFMDHRKRHAC
jgi:hypothetical protein